MFRRSDPRLTALLSRERPLREYLVVELFQSVGPVDTVNIVRDQMTGRARGFAFVEMQTDTDAQNAIQRLNDTELDGRKLAVNEARPKPTGGGGGGRPGGGGRGPRREPRW